MRIARARHHGVRFGFADGDAHVRSAVKPLRDCSARVDPIPTPTEGERSEFVEIGVRRFSRSALVESDQPVAGAAEYAAFSRRVEAKLSFE